MSQAEQLAEQIKALSVADLLRLAAIVARGKAMSANVEALAEKIRALTVANKLRMAIALIEQGELRQAETIIGLAKNDLLGHRLLRMPLPTGKG